LEENKLASLDLSELVKWEEKHERGNNRHNNNLITSLGDVSYEVN